MVSLISRTSILIVSRLINFSILLLSPIFLVRILDLHTYGQYREFILYAMLFTNFLGFSISSNLFYFIPQWPEKEDKYVTHTALFLLASFLIGLILIFLGKGFILSKTSYDFILPLVIYLFFTINMNFWDTYWLSKKRSDYVLYFSGIYMLARIGVVLATAYFTQDVRLIIYSIGAVEATRFIFVLIFFAHRKSLTRKLDSGIMKQQLAYFVPLGIGGVLWYFNMHVSELFVSVRFGVEFLALYTIGSYQIPILNVVRSSVVDAIFPDVVEKTKIDPIKGLELWQKSNVIFCFVSFPIFTIFFYYADVFITTLFTSTYAASIPIFKIYLLLMIARAFEMTVPLRAMNKNKYFVSGTIIRLVINVVLLVILSKFIGLLGPAVALVVSGYIINIYLGYYILKLYKIKITGLCMWAKVFKIAACAIIGLPVLFLSNLVDLNDILKAIFFSVAYLFVFLWMIYYLNIEEPCLIFNRLMKKMQLVKN